MKIFNHPLKINQFGSFIKIGLIRIGLHSDHILRMTGLTLCGIEPG